MLTVVSSFPSVTCALVAVTVMVKVSDSSHTESSVMLTSIHCITSSVEVVAGKVRGEDTAV